MTHELIAFQQDFLDDGDIAICSCGWESLKQIDRTAAIIAHSKHIRAMEPAVCSACGCKIDADGCGCNPEGA